MSIIMKPCSDRVYFEVDGVIDLLQACKFQSECGYPHYGYGIYEFRVREGKTFWECSTSCD